jgi:hypothetical protein
VLSGLPLPILTATTTLFATSGRPVEGFFEFAGKHPADVVPSDGFIMLIIYRTMLKSKTYGFSALQVYFALKINLSSSSDHYSISDMLTEKFSTSGRDLVGI